MTEPTIRLDQLDALAGLLPETTPPRTVAEVARWGMELLPQQREEGLPLVVAIELDDSKLTEHLAWMAERAVHQPTGEPAVMAEDHVSGAEGACAFEGEAPAVEPEGQAAETEGHAAAAAQGEPLNDLTDVGAEENASEPRAFSPEPVEVPGEVPTEASEAEPPQEPVHLAGGNPWTAEDDAELLRMKRAGKRGAEIAKVLGRSAFAINARANKLAGKPAAAARPPVKPARAKTASPPRKIDAIVEGLATLDDSFTPADDKALVDQRYVGASFSSIADMLGCDEDTAKARWRAILKCEVEHSGGLITRLGWANLRAAAAHRAASAEA